MRKIYLSVMCCLGVSILQAQFTVNGNASQIGMTSEYQLTPQLRDQKGSIWNNTPINLANDFIIHVELNFGVISESNPADGAPGFTTGADGIVFVLQRNGLNALGDPGEDIGYGGTDGTGAITNSFAVEFDTWQNINGQQGNYNHLDPEQDHVAFLSGGNTIHSGPNSHGVYALAGEVENGQWYPATFMWDATAKKFTVTFMGTTYTYSGDVATLIGAGTTYWGFTSATGRGVNDHRVRILSCNNTVIPCGNNGKKVTICHIPPGNPANRHEICVAWSAVPAHLAHGDCLGMCSGGARTATIADEEAHGVEMNVYPNPSRGNLSVQVNHLEGKAELTITNGRGLVVERRNLSAASQQVNFDLRKYGAGIYMVKLVNGEEVKTTKVLVQE